MEKKRRREEEEKVQKRAKQLAGTRRMLREKAAAALRGGGLWHEYMPAPRDGYLQRPQARLARPLSSPSATALAAHTAVMSGPS